MSQAGPSTRTTAALAWLPSVALLAAAADMSQVAAGTGPVGVMRLACMVSTVYVLVGLLCAAAVAWLRRSVKTRALDDVGVLGGSLALWGLIVGGGYLNLVHLPAITSAVSITANLGLLASAWATWVVLTRSKLTARVARHTRSAGGVALGGLAVTVAVSLPHPQATGVTTRVRIAAPNVIVVVVDSLRFDRTGLGGGRDTPNIDTLARQGTTYGRAYAQASWTKPSVASLFTSLYPSTHGANLRRDRLSSEPQTIAGMFAAAGYRTAVFSANPWVSPAFGFDRGVATFVESEHETFVRLVVLLRLLKLPDRVLTDKPIGSLLAKLESFFGLGRPRHNNCDRDKALIDSFEGWIAAGDDGPLFAYLHLMSPHIPYDPPGGPHAFANRDQVALLRSTEALPPAKLDSLLDLYSRCVAHGDLMVGRIMEILDQQGLSESTVLIVTSDHGEEFFEHGHWGHGKSLYDELVHVPLVMRGPGIAAGIANASVVMLVDVAPTVASLAGLDPPSPIAGENISEPGEQRSAYAELLREGGVEMYMLYAGGSKYLESTVQLGQDLESELYDIDRDPLEGTNLAEQGLGDWSDRLAQLRSAARGAHVTRDAGSEISRDSQQRLRALGYLN